MRIGMPITVRRGVDVPMDAHVSSANVVSNHFPQSPDQSLFALVIVRQAAPAREAVFVRLDPSFATAVLWGLAMSVAIDAQHVVIFISVSLVNSVTGNLALPRRSAKFTPQ
jgi:uncharacterized membrane protein YoaK (UPF0700 family)